MAAHAYITRRTALKAVVATSAIGVVALPAAALAVGEMVDPAHKANEAIIDALRRHRTSLDADDGQWKDIEAAISGSPPLITSRQGAIACLSAALKIDNMGRFETALVGSALAFLETGDIN